MWPCRSDKRVYGEPYDQKRIPRCERRAGLPWEKDALRLGQRQTLRGPARKICRNGQVLPGWRKQPSCLRARKAIPTESPVAPEGLWIVPHRAVGTHRPLSPGEGNLTVG